MNSSKLKSNEQLGRCTLHFSYLGKRGTNFARTGSGIGVNITKGEFRMHLKVFREDINL